MPARSGTVRGRARARSGALQWIALLAAGAVIMGLTFALGILVGRQWSRPASATVVPEGGARKTVPPGKRNGLTGADVEGPQVDQKQLTFYQTLTAPLGRGSADASQRREDKAKASPAPDAARAEAPQPPPYPYASRGETVIEKPATDSSPAAEKVSRAPAEPAGPWAVQAAAF